MRISEERISELHRKMDRAKRAQWYRRICGMACAGCFAAALTVALWVSSVPGHFSESAPESAAASVFSGQVAGSLLIVLVAFCLGVVVTVLCFRLRRNMEEEHDDRKR